MPERKRFFPVDVFPKAGNLSNPNLHTWVSGAAWRGEAMRRTMKMAEKTVEFILVIWRGSGSTSVNTGLAEAFIIEIRSRPILATLAQIRKKRYMQ